MKDRLQINTKCLKYFEKEKRWYFLIKFKEKINEHYLDLTKGQKKVADFLLADPTAFATHTAKKVGELIGVSETMVIRFCYAIDYNSYSKLQTDIREFIFDLSYQKANLSEKESNHYSSIYHTMISDITFIKDAAQHLNDSDVNTTIKRMNAADIVLVSGIHASFAMAHWFSFSLNLLKGNTFLYRPEFDLYLDQINEKSVLIVFSFYRYAMETIKLAEFAKSKGAFVIAITDSRNAPISKHADIVHDLKLPNKVIYQTAPIVFSFLNALLTRYTHLFSDQNTLREKLYKQIGAHQFFAQ